MDECNFAVGGGLVGQPVTVESGWYSRNLSIYRKVHPVSTFVTRILLRTPYEEMQMALESVTES